jgi:hypothetical protein
MISNTANSRIINEFLRIDLKLLAGFNNATIEYPENNDKNIIKMISKA